MSATGIALVEDAKHPSAKKTTEEITSLLMPSLEIIRSDLMVFTELPEEEIVADYDYRSGVTDTQFLSTGQQAHVDDADVAYFASVGKPTTSFPGRFKSYRDAKSRGQWGALKGIPVANNSIVRASRLALHEPPLYEHNKHRAFLRVLFGATLSSNPN